MSVGAWTKCLLLVGALAGAHAQAQSAGQNAERIAKVQQLFDVMHLETVYGQMTAQVMQSVTESEQQLFPSDNLTPSLKAEQTQFQAKVLALVTDNLAWQRLEPDFAKLYATAYTGEQLDGLIAFYQSPLGQAVLAKTPELLQQSNAIAQEHMAAAMPQLRQMMHDEMTKIQAITAAKPGAGSTK